MFIFDMYVCIVYGVVMLELYFRLFFEFFENIKKRVKCEFSWFVDYILYDDGYDFYG